MKIQNILLACDDDGTFLSFWPTVSFHWQSLGYKVYLGLLTNKSDNSEYINKIKQYGNGVFIFKPNDKYNIIIQTKLLRFYISRYFLNDICCVLDIDFYTLDNHKHAEDITTDDVITNNKISTLGYNAYISYKNLNIENVRKQGIYRFPACPFIANGQIIFNFISNFRPVNTFDSLLNNINNIYDNLKNEKSDENILYYLMTQNLEWSKNNIIFNIRNDFKDLNGKWCMYAIKRINRGKKLIYNKDKLDNGYYIDLCPSRPYNKYEINNILDYLNIPKNLQNIKF